MEANGVNYPEFESNLGTPEMLEFTQLAYNHGVGACTIQTQGGHAN